MCLLSGAQMYWDGTMATELSDTCQEERQASGHSDTSDKMKHNTHDVLSSGPCHPCKHQLWSHISVTLGLGKGHSQGMSLVAHWPTSTANQWLLGSGTDVISKAKVESSNARDPTTTSNVWLHMHADTFASRQTHMDTHTPTTITISTKESL